MKVLLLDTNLASLPIYERLVNLGHIVYVAGAKPDDVLAMMTKNFIEIDYSEIDAVEVVFYKYSFDFVIPGCNDVSFRIACQFAERNKHSLNLDSLRVNNILNIKSEFKDFALSNNIKVPKVFNKDSLNFLLNQKFIIKPIDSYSGKGISILTKENVSYLDDFVQLAIDSSKNKKYLIEEFVEGDLFSHSAFIKDGSIYLDFIVAEYCLNNNFAVDTSWVVPINEFPRINLIRNEIQKIIKELNLCDGLIHTQFICKEDDFWILELTRRCPGDLYSLLIQKSTGFDYAKEYVENILKNNDSKSPEIQHNNILRKTISYKNTTQWVSLTIDTKNYELDEFYPLEKSGALLPSAPIGRGGILFLKSK